MLYVPNSIFSNIAIENPSRMSNRRIFETIGIRYDDVAKVGIIVENIRKMLETHKDIDQKKSLMVYLNKFIDFRKHYSVKSMCKINNEARPRVIFKSTYD